MQTSTATSKIGLPADAQERAFKVRQARMVEEERRVQAALTELSEHYRSERVRLLGAEADRLLRDFAIAHRRADEFNGPPPRRTEEEQRAIREGNAAFAAEHRIDLSRLEPLRAELDLRFQRIVNADLSPEAEVTEAEADAGAEGGAGAQRGDPSADLTFYQFGSWDAGGSWSMNSPYWLEKFDSHFLPAWNRTGSHIHMHMWNTGGSDKMSGQRNNGYLVEYKMPRNGRVRMSFGVTCAFSEQMLYAEDEWGFSEIHSVAIDRGLFEIYSGWDDYSPDAQAYSWNLATGTWLQKAGYAHHYPVVPGAYRSCSVMTSNVFPKDATLLVYAATHQMVHANLDDTSLNGKVNSAWYVNSISVDAV